jgi:mannose-1-phosphate guanylyltransferase / mannose-6-phosphate isomerase
MALSDISPVILCGGSGKRLWPLSRKSHPKQFGRLLGDKSLLQSTVERFGEIGCGSPVMLTGADYRFIVGEQMSELGVEPRSIVIEPEGRNTAPAIAAAAVMLAADNPDGLMLVAPSDHVLRDLEAFTKAVEEARAAALDGSLVTFGITPDRPETGYGYIELEAPPGGMEALPFVRFVEKPDEETAQEMMASGRYLWNSGMFLFPVKRLIEAFEKHQPAMLAAVRQAVSEGKEDLDFFRLGKVYSAAEDISIDYAIMEREQGMVVPADLGWNDLGSWQTIWQEAGPDEKGVATVGLADAIECENTFLRVQGRDMRLIGLGLKNIVAVATRDAVLVADMERSQDVKLAVELLKAKGATQAESFARHHRPWGWYETLDLGDRFQVKEIMVKPGGVLSLQSHHHRSEHWIVVAGTAKVTVNEEVKLVTENQSVYIPLGAVHRMENPGKVPMHLIEVQTGTYLGEDDIIRYEDVYARESED